MSTSAKYLSCRDLFSSHVLRKQGISNVLMTGCPVWYDLPSIGKPMRLPSPANRVVFTPAQLPLYQNVSIRVAEALRKQFPHAELVCSFHRGISKKDKFTRQDEVSNNQVIEAAATSLGYQIVDLSHSGEGTSLYDRCDLHVGFRLHAHLYTLSKRTPSLLLHEDGRGVAASATLNLRGFDAFKRSTAGRLPMPTPRLQRLVERRFRGVSQDAGLPDRVGEYVGYLKSTSFAACAGTGAVIDAHFEVMKQFLQSLP
jgi:hypothetical protein